MSENQGKALMFGVRGNKMPSSSPEWQHAAAEPVKTENPFEGQQFLAPQFDCHREGPQNSAALRLSKPSKCGSWSSHVYMLSLLSGNHGKARDNKFPQGMFCSFDIIIAVFVTAVTKHAQ
jgi:hypothetical protein